MLALTINNEVIIIKLAYICLKIDFKLYDFDFEKRNCSDLQQSDICSVDLMPAT